MIFIDSNQLMVSNLFALYKGEVDTCGLDKIRYAFCRGIYWYIRNYRTEYGDPVLCYDSDRYWRKDFFPHYKATRKRQRATSGIDWSKIGSLFNEVRLEIEENVPIIQIATIGSEADDQIAVLSEHLNGISNIIISSDKDFQQLHHISKLKQYSPAHKKMVFCEDPKSYLIEHVIKGDPSDGIPNVLSDDDTMINPDKKQTIMNKKRMDKILIGEMDAETERRYERNKTLIDFSMIPSYIVENIVTDFESEINRNESGNLIDGLLSYFGGQGIMRIVEEADMNLRFNG